jgi:hypothetical protein
MKIPFLPSPRREKGDAGSAGEPPALAQPQEKWLDPPPHPPELDPEEGLQQPVAAKVENIFSTLPLPHFGHAPPSSLPPRPAEYRSKACPQDLHLYSYIGIFPLLFSLFLHETREVFPLKRYIIDA